MLLLLLQSKLHHRHHGRQTLLDAGSGRAYYFNPETGVTQWKRSTELDAATTAAADGGGVKQVVERQQVVASVG